MSIHVDDLSISVTRRNLDILIADTTKVALKIKDALQEELGLPIAEAKSQVIATSTRVEKAWTAATGNKFGHLVATAMRLGVDHALRKVILRPVQIKRKNRYLKRKVLVDKLRGKGAKAHVKVFHAGLMSGLFFGAECSTPDMGIITKAIKHCIAVHGLRQAGVPHQLSLIALPPAQDPKEHVLDQALIRCHREVWYNISPHPNHRDALSMGALQMALGGSTKKSTATGVGAPRTSKCSTQSSEGGRMDLNIGNQTTGRDRGSCGFTGRIPRDATGQVQKTMTANSDQGSTRTQAPAPPSRVTHTAVA